MAYLVGRPLNLAITATAGWGFILFGYDQDAMSDLPQYYFFSIISRD